MRMHRGSSKGTEGNDPVPGTLPLSASPFFEVEFELVRAGRPEVRRAEVRAGTPIRVALRSVGQLAEGCAVFERDRSLPLDTRIEGPGRFRIVPTFSGG